MPPLEMKGSLVVVDRDGQAVRDLRRMAGFPGVMFFHFSSWADACEELRRNRHNGVLLDLGFLEESPEDWFERIEESAAGIPVVLMEKEVGPEISTRDDENVFGYLLKPLKASAVRTIIRQIFQLRAMDEDLRNLEGWISQHALKDRTTGLYNARYLEERISSEFKRAVRYGLPLSAVAVCVHSTKGDEQEKNSLQVPADFPVFLLRFARGCDVVTDAGEGCFTIILPDTPKKGALIFAHRLLEKMKERFPFLKEPGAGLSLGVAAYPQDGVKAGENLLDLMRRAVQRARNSGGNMVYSFPGLDSIRTAKA